MTSAPTGLRKAMNQNDTGRSPEAELFRDMGQSTVRSGVTVNLEPELMRLADDPLLLRALLDRGECRETASFQTPSAPQLQALQLAGKTVAQASQTASVAAYAHAEPRFFPSEAPVSYLPTVEDREGALSFEEPREERGERSVASGHLLLGAGMAGLAILAATVLF